MEVTYLIGALVVLLVLAALAVLALRWSRRRSLRRQFGPEYDYTVTSTGDRRAAERELEARRRRFAELQLRDLDPEERRELGARWRSIQVDFVDRPGQAIEQADRLVVDAMRARGYPEGEFPQRLADSSVEHPESAAEYREARNAAERSRRGEATTEELRRGMLCYRNVMQALLGFEEVPGTETAAGTPRREVMR